MNLEFLNNRYNELNKARICMEHDLATINGHISEVRHFLHEMAKATTQGNQSDPINEEEKAL